VALAFSQPSENRFSPAESRRYEEFPAGRYCASDRVGGVKPPLQRETQDSESPKRRTTIRSPRATLRGWGTRERLFTLGVYPGSVGRMGLGVGRVRRG
jgi:hypothetical protein